MSLVGVYHSAYHAYSRTISDNNTTWKQHVTPLSFWDQQSVNKQYFINIESSTQPADSYMLDISVRIKNN